VPGASGTKAGPPVAAAPPDGKSPQQPDAASAPGTQRRGNGGRPAQSSQ